MTPKRTLSLAARNALVYFVLFIVAIGFSAWLLISYSYKEVLNITENRLAHTAEMVHIKFESYFKNVETDIDQLAKSPLLNRFVEKPDSINLELLAAEYEAFLQAKPNYFQVRLIGISDYGEELIRIERRQKSIFKTPKNALQNKSDRDYFKELINLPVDSLYLSKIDLNREFGKVSTPHIPTARMGVKMKGGELNDFMIVININLNSLFSELKSSLPQNDQLRITNQNGHYIFHPDSSKAFTFDFNKDGAYAQEYQEPLANISTTALVEINETAMNRFTELSYNRNDYQLTSILSAKKAVVLASFYEWRQAVLLASGSIALVFLAIGFLYMRKQVRELKAITKKLTLFSSDLAPQKLPIERQDEIGELAREFEKMSASISQSHAEIELAKQDAEQAHEEKTAFLENMSHEIRNPLQSILGAIDILNQNEQLPHQQSFIESIRFSSKQLQSLATDILDFNKIKDLTIELQPSWANISDFCQETYQSSKYLANSKNIDLNFINQLNNINTLAYFDGSRLYQILNNLITNALKFTDNGDKVDFILSETKNNALLFQIIDTGNGLTEAQQLLIKDRHYAEGKSAGAGLGIPIVINLLKIHQSTLNINSTLNKGSEFSFVLDLPVKAVKTEVPVAIPPAFENQPSIDQNILIIEDDPQIIQWYQHTLHQFQLKFLTHPSQLPQVEGIYFSHIICDYTFGRTQLVMAEILPKLMAQLKYDGQIMIVSGNTEIDRVDGVIFLEKPVNQNTLLSLVQPKKVDDFEQPDFSAVEKDYDHQPALIKNVMTLMIREWEKDQKLINDSIAANKIADFEAVQHRLINSIKRLKVNNLNDLFNEVKALFYTPEITEKQKQINASFDFYIQAMKTYLQRIH